MKNVLFVCVFLLTLFIISYFKYIKKIRKEERERKEHEKMMKELQAKMYIRNYPNGTGASGYAHPDYKSC